jgi:hypothetical protein
MCPDPRDRRDVGRARRRRPRCRPERAGERQVQPPSAGRRDGRGRPAGLGPREERRALTSSGGGRRRRGPRPPPGRGRSPSPERPPPDGTLSRARPARPPAARGAAPGATGERRAGISKAPGRATRRPGFRPPRALSAPDEATRRAERPSPGRRAGLRDLPADLVKLRVEPGGARELQARLRRGFEPGPEGLLPLRAQAALEVEERPGAEGVGLPDGMGRLGGHGEAPPSAVTHFRSARWTRLKAT